MTVIVVSFFESVMEDHSKDHPVTVTRYGATRSPPNPYTTLLDSTGVMKVMRRPWSRHSMVRACAKQTIQRLLMA